MKKWLVLMMLGGMGCEAALPEPTPLRYFAAVQLSAPSATDLPDPGPTISQTELDTFEPIVEGFQKNHELLLGQSDVREQLDRIENVYIATGRYLELVGIYQRDVAEKGAKSHAAARLGWAYIRLGQEKPAKELVALLKTEESERAMAFFLEGAAHLQWDAGTEESNQGLFRAWSRTLELDPSFKGFEGISAAQMRAQLERLKPQLGEPVDALALAQERVQGVTAAALAATAAAPTEVEPEAPTVEPEAPSVEPEVTAAEPDDPERQYRITVARAELALNEAKYQEAEELFIQAKALVPNGFAAEFGHLRAGWGQEGSRPRIRPRLEELAKRDDLTGRQAYDLGIFLLNVVQDKAMAAGVLNRVKTLDPELAGRVNIDKILQ